METVSRYFARCSSLHSNLINVKEGAGRTKFLAVKLAHLDGWVNVSEYGKPESAGAV
jgi:hypothetical protein